MLEGAAAHLERSSPTISHTGNPDSARAASSTQDSQTGCVRISPPYSNVLHRTHLVLSCANKLLSVLCRAGGIAMDLTTGLKKTIGAHPGAGSSPGHVRSGSASSCQANGAWSTIWSRAACFHLCCHQSRFVMCPGRPPRTYASMHTTTRGASSSPNSRHGGMRVSTAAPGEGLKVNPAKLALLLDDDLEECLRPSPAELQHTVDLSTRHRS